MHAIFHWVTHHAPALLFCNTMNLLVQQFKDDKRWVNWRYKEVNSKKTKIPYAISGLPASSTDSFTWSTYDEAKNASKDIGIIFTPEQNLLGIDIDKCLTGNQITHEQKETIANFILETETYCEVSPSGTGLHLFLKIDGQLPLISNKKSPYEIYTSGRYFTVTEKPYGSEREVRTVTPDEALRLLGILGYPWKSDSGQSVRPDNVGHVGLTDDVLLKKMLASKAGEKIKALYNGDISAYNNDLSNADMALCSYLAFWTGNNPAQLERLWLSSTLGQREKTTGRKDYRDRTISNAIAHCKEFYKPPALSKPVVSPIELLMTRTGKTETPTLCVENICRILRQSPNFRFDEFKVFHEIKRGEKWKEVEVADVLELQTRISINYDFFQKVGKDMVYDAILHVCKEHSYDSARDWLKSLTWDKKNRLETWLSSAYGVEKTSYYKAVGENWLKGLAKRINDPGCKFDYVLVLEGKQGLKKSTSLSVLGGNWHVETTMSTESKDFFMLFCGKAIIEFSEGETLSRTEVKRMKSLITVQSDKYRMPYERVSKEFPRRCVFAMTTNETEYLRDDTGNRRWLPVPCEKCDIDWLEENREQLFAEAYHRVITLRENTYEFPEEETEDMQNSRRELDPNADQIIDWYTTTLSKRDREEGVTAQQAYISAVHRNAPFTKPMNRYEEILITGVFKSALKLSRVRHMVNGARSSRWFATYKTPINSDPILAEELYV